MTSIAILLSWIFVSRHQAKLSERDKIVLADFTNTTADPVFDDALRQGLCSQLEQSPFLNLPSDERINQMTFAAQLNPVGSIRTRGPSGEPRCCGLACNGFEPTPRTP